MMKNIGKNVKLVALATGGGVAAKVVKNKVVPMIPGISNYPIAGDLVPLAAGLFLMNNKNSMLQDIGLGMAVGAASDLVAAHVPGIGEITGEDMNGVAEEIIHGLNEEIQSILNEKVGDDVLNEELSEELSDDINEELSDEVNDEFSDELSEELPY